MESSFFCELVMQEDDQLTTNQCNFMDYIDEELASLLGEDFPNYNISPAGSDSSSSSALINNSVTGIRHSPPQIEPPAKQRKFNNSSDFSNLQGVANLNFADPNNPPQRKPQIDEVSEKISPQIAMEVSRNEEIEGGNNNKRARKENNNSKKSRVRPPSQTYDHIIAERKRRELLSERFVALSAIVPGLKKMDKTSVLGDAINYMKQLQEKVKTLEEQVSKQTVESVVLVKRSHITADDNDDKNCSQNEHSLPEIEARVCNKSILIKIHCEKRKGILMKVLGHVEKLNLSVVTSNVAPFGGCALDITIIAEMEKEFNSATEDVVRTLRTAILAAA